MAAVEYHWIIALSGTVGSERKQMAVGDEGLVTRDPSVTTRRDVCLEVIASIKSNILARTGLVLENCTITFFQLEPNHL